MSLLLQTELLRKQVYESFLNEVQKRLRCVLKFKEICHLALRFIFNCMVDRSKPPMEEPIFFLHDATVAVPRLALAQLQKDLANHKADILASLEFIQCFRRACAEFNRKSSSGLVSKQMAQAELIDYDPAGFLTFRGRKYPDLADLGKLHSHARPEALALQIRYEYLHLSNHGLAFDYASNGHLKKDGLECFASAFNHYFDHYCSAFPDLEKAFGSLGSFFDQESPILQTHKTLYINPPFDESLVQAINDRVLSISGLKLHIVLPDWDNFTALEQLKHNPHTVSVNLYPKGTLKFLNFMTRPPQEIYPCNIALIRLDTGSLLNKASAKRKIDDEGPSQEDPPAKREKITDIKTAVE